MLKILMAASEGTPFIKTGGLADVVGSLSKALSEKGIDVRVIMPLYGDIRCELKQKLKYRGSIYVYIGMKRVYCGIFECVAGGITYYFMDNEHYFKRSGLYGFWDDGERFSFFDRASLEVLPAVGFCPDIIHCHDWQSGMIPALLEAQYRDRDFYRKIRTLFTIHNLKYQGVFPRSVLNDLLGLGDEYFTSDKLEFYGDTSFLKGGLVYSNLLSTVSPTYAAEIQDPYLGERMDGLLRARKGQLYGILNGIDYREWDPSADGCLEAPYCIRGVGGKMRDKLDLQRRMDLDEGEDIPLIGIISRLTPQKGFDLVERVLDRIIGLGAEIAVLGTGDRKYEDMFRDAQSRYNHRVACRTVFDNSLAHRIYAGADMFLMPSQFEPCGLGQMIALRYGAIPIVRETGGLKDTVVPYNEYTGEGNGFSFTNYNADDMLFTIERAVDFYRNREIWGRIMKKAMSDDFSWRASAQRYTDIYETLAK